jgi:hypothetical protein
MKASEEDERRSEVRGWRREGEREDERGEREGRWRRRRAVEEVEGGCQRMRLREGWETSEKVVEGCAVTVCHKRRLFFRFLFLLSRSGLSLRQKGKSMGANFP